ncbi:DUF6993 domain-containing protein [Paenarthrobacter sp. NPDC057355]|uniref:DUF6993 domain-containing protein n=1 Tax=Paenarthrobacter sp. NPDC057355 TaxID=3346105 RepID=UPI003628149B
MTARIRSAREFNQHVCRAWQNYPMNSNRTLQEPAGPHLVSGSLHARLLTAALLLSVLVTGCSAPELRHMGGPSSLQHVESPVTSFSAATASKSETTELTKTMESVLTRLTSDASKPAQEQIRNQLVAAGIPASTLEVSASRTPTGLDVDAIEAAAQSGHSCIIGQIRSQAVTIVTLPVLSTGKCLIGDAR